MRGSAAFVLLGMSFVACNKDEGIQYDQYNATNDTLTLQVGTETVLDPVEISLMSSTGQVEVGLARVDPGGGPIGTNHDFVIEVYDEFQDVVDRASVRLKSPGRGEDEYDLEQDSADEGVYLVTLERKVLKASNAKTCSRSACGPSRKTRSRKSEPCGSDARDPCPDRGATAP